MRLWRLSFLPHVAQMLACCAGTSVQAQGQPILHQAAIPSPMVLSSTHSNQLMCTVDLLRGGLTLHSQQAATSAPHMAAQAASLPAATAGQYSNTSSKQLAAASVIMAACQRKPSRGAELAAAVCQLAVGKGYTDGFAVPPAMLDASLHLGAVLAASISDVDAEARVPVGWGAFAASSMQPHAASWAAANIAGDGSSAAGTSSYTISSCEQLQGAAISLNELQVGPLCCLAHMRKVWTDQPRMRIIVDSDMALSRATAVMISSGVPVCNIPLSMWTSMQILSPSPSAVHICITSNMHMTNLCVYDAGQGSSACASSLPASQHSNAVPA